MPRRVLGYARVSSEEQARGTSLQDQQKAISTFSQGRGLKVTRFYVEAESGIRAKAEKREQMAALMRDVGTGDLVLCDKLDRWSRDAEFSYSSVRQILERGANFIAVSENLDASTPDGDTALGFRILFAREEHKRIKARMVGTRQLIRDQGYYVEGLPPFGYRRSHPKGHRGLEKNILVIEEAEAAIVRRIFAMAIGGRSIAHISDRLELKRDRVADALHRRMYVGELQNSKDEWIAGKHPAIVDIDTFVRASMALQSRRLNDIRPHTEARTSGWILRDVAMCAHCGARMAASHGASRSYYRCCRACTGRYVHVESVETQAASLILERFSELRAALSSAPKPVAIADPTAKLARLESRRVSLLDAFTDGLMTRDELRERLARLDAERLRLSAQERVVDPKARREMLAEVRKIERAWQLMTGQERRQAVNDLVLRAEIAAGEAPILVWRAAEDLSTEE